MSQNMEISSLSSCGNRPESAAFQIAEKINDIPAVRPLLTALKFCFHLTFMHEMQKLQK